ARARTRVDRAGRDARELGVELLRAVGRAADRVGGRARGAVGRGALTRPADRVGGRERVEVGQGALPLAGELAVDDHARRLGNGDAVGERLAAQVVVDQ